MDIRKRRATLDHDALALMRVARFLSHLSNVDWQFGPVVVGGLVLAVEDDDSLAFVVDEVLRDWLGPRSLLVTDGEEALRYVWGEHPELVPLDLSLPGLDWLKTARLLSPHPSTRETRSVVFTTLGVARHRAREAGCEAFLEIAFDVDQLPTKVCEQLVARFPPHVWRL